MKSKYYEKRLIDKVSYRKIFLELRKKHSELKQKISKVETRKENSRSEGRTLNDPKKYFYLADGTQITYDDDNNIIRIQGSAEGETKDAGVKQKRKESEVNYLPVKSLTGGF